MVAVITTTVPVNTLPVIAAFAGLILLIFIAAMFSKIKLIGVVGAFLLILLGIWLFTNGIYVETGKETVSKTDIITVNGSNTTLQYVNESMVISYSLATIPPFISASGASSTDLGNFIGFVLILLGLYGLIYYSRIFNEWH